MNHMVIIIVVVAAGTLVWLGALVGSEAQKHILRGHEGTRADKLRELHRLRDEHIRRRRIELYGPPPLRPVPDLRHGADDQDRWWRRHPGGEGPVRRTPDDSDPRP